MSNVDTVHALDLTRGSLPPDNDAHETLSEAYRRRFIDQYLHSREYDINEVNRATVSQGIELYADGGPVLPGDLALFLDNLYRLDGTCWSED